MVRKIKINGKEYIGNSNGLLTRYIVDRVLKDIGLIEGLSEVYSYASVGVPDIARELIDTLCKVTISKEEARDLLCLDSKEIADMVTELYPDVNEEDFECIADDLIDDIISETFNGLIDYTETFYEKGTYCKVRVFYGVMLNENIEIVVSPSYIEHYIRRCTNRFRIISLDAIKKLKNVYSERLYSQLMYELSLLENNEMPVKVPLSLEYLKRLFRIHGDKYEKYGCFKRRILTGCLDEINQLDYNIAFNEIKDGRKVVAIEFEISQ